MINKKNLFLISILCILARIFFFISGTDDLNKLHYPDEKNYYEQGANNFKEQGFKYFLTERSLYIGPINILWVSAFPDFKTNKIANLTLNVFTAYLIFLITSIYSSNLIAFFSYLIFLSYPSFTHFGTTILTEPPYIFLLVLSIYLISLGFKKDSKKLVFLSGIIFALATLTRPTTQFFPLFIICLYLPCFFLTRFFKVFNSIRINYLLTFILAFSILVLPWFIKNKLLFNKIGIANGSGAVLYLGNDWRKNGDEPFYSNMHFDTYEITKPYSHLDTKGDSLLTKKAVEFIVKDPIFFLQNTILKSFKVLFGYPKDYFAGRNTLKDFMSFPDNKVFYQNIIKLLLHSFLGLLIIFSFFKFPKNETDFFIQSLILYFIIIHSITFPIPRLFLPALAISCCLVKNVFLNKKKIITFIPLYIGIILFLSFSRINHSDYVSPRRLNFFKAEKIDILNEGVFSTDKNKNGFYKITKSQNHIIEYKINPVKTAVNKVLIFNISQNNLEKNINKVQTLTIAWSYDGVTYQAGSIRELRILTDRTANYLFSPSLFNNDWSSSEQEIKKIKILINGRFSSLIKINLLSVAR